MMKLSAFWKTHRLGMIYGLIWAFVAIRLLSGMLNGHPELKWTVFISAIITGTIMTAIMRRRLNGRTEGGALWQAPLSLLVGTVIFGMVSSLLEVLWGSFHGTLTGPILIGPVLDSPLKTLIPLTLIGTPLLFLACLNNWHLWKRVNQPPALPQAAH